MPRQIEICDGDLNLDLESARREEFEIHSEVSALNLLFEVLKVQKNLQIGYSHNARNSTEVTKTLSLYIYGSCT